MRTHGMSNSKEYKTWEMMIQRCTNEKFDKYPLYGGRGISFDPRWSSFENFLADMGERPDGKTLDRIDVNGNYCKENCRWADSTTQLYNRRPVKNSSGRTGVYLHKASGKWTSQICFKKTNYHLGLFDDFEDAVKARESAEIKFYGKTKTAVNVEDIN